MAQAAAVVEEVWAAPRVAVAPGLATEATEVRAAVVETVVPGEAAPGAREGLPTEFSTSEKPRF